MLGLALLALPQKRQYYDGRTRIYRATKQGVWSRKTGALRAVAFDE